LLDNFNIIDEYLLTPFFFFDELPGLVKGNSTLINKGIGGLLIALGVSNIFGIPEAQSYINYSLGVYIFPLLVSYYEKCKKNCFRD